MGCAVHPALSPPQSPMQKARRQQMDMIAELKKKQMVKEPLIYEGKDGAIEDIISGEGQGVSPGAWRSESLARPCQNRVPMGCRSVGWVPRLGTQPCDGREGAQCWERSADSEGRAAAGLLGVGHSGLGSQFCCPCTGFRRRQRCSHVGAAGRASLAGALRAVTARSQGATKPCWGAQSHPQHLPVCTAKPPNALCPVS